MSELFELGIVFQILVEGLVQIAIMLDILIDLLVFGRRLTVEIEECREGVFRLGTHRVST